MDRRTWVQLITILAAARDGRAQQRGSTTTPPAGNGAGRGGGRGGQNQQPMRIEKAQVAGALKLLGLEFQDSEIDGMVPGVNQALDGYESLRKADAPPGRQPRFAF